MNEPDTVIKNTAAVLPKTPAAPGSAQDAVPVAQPASVNPPEAPGEVPPPGDLTPSQALAYFEGLVEQSLAREDQTAKALLAIHEQKLYRLNHASFRDYLKQRWGFSRSRGYQLLHQARVTRYRLQQGQPPPPNERQARTVAADGNPAPRTAEADSYERHLARTTRYLATKLAQMLPSERRRWLRDMRAALDRFENDLEPPPPHSPQGRSADTARSDSSHPAVVDTPKPPPPDPPLSVALPAPGLEEQTAEATDQRQTVSSVTTRAESPDGLPPHPKAARDIVAEWPEPCAATGVVHGYTMEQARKLGLLATAAPARRPQRNS